MEDTLRADEESSRTRMVNRVLILVLMEDTLREGSHTRMVNRLAVLILVLMEDTLRVGAKLQELWIIYVS